MYFYVNLGAGLHYVRNDQISLLGQRIPLPAVSNFTVMGEKHAVCSGEEIFRYKE